MVQGLCLWYKVYSLQYIDVCLCICLYAYVYVCTYVYVYAYLFATLAAGLDGAAPLDNPAK